MVAILEEEGRNKPGLHLRLGEDRPARYRREPAPIPDKDLDEWDAAIREFEERHNRDIE
jgi:hypothetical protein